MPAQNLPIYKTALDLTKQIVGITKNFPVNLRVAISDELIKNCIYVLTMITQAKTNEKYRMNHIDEIIKIIDHINIQLRISHELKIINTKQYSSTSNLTVSVGKQANGWAKSIIAPKNVPAMA